MRRRAWPASARLLAMPSQDPVLAPGHVQTVAGRVAAADLGFVLPHEHTGIQLWQIPNRWDYWELTPDDALVLPELAAYQAAGGGTLVDLTLAGVGRDPLRLRRYAEASGLHIVMGAGWYRTAYYPVEARIDRRSVDDLADELVAEIETGVDGTGIRPGDHRRDRDRQAVADGPRGTSPPRRRPSRATNRPGDHDALGDVASWPRPVARFRGGRCRSGPGRHRPRRLLSIARALPRDRPARGEPRVRLSWDELHPDGAPRRAASSTWPAS